MEQAYFFMETLEFTAKIKWIVQQMNGDRELSTRNVEQLILIVGISSHFPHNFEQYEVYFNHDYSVKSV